MTRNNPRPSTRGNPQEARTWSLNVFLIKQDLRADDRIVGDLRELTRVPVRLADGADVVDARLYFATRISDRPKWASFFGDLLGEISLPQTVSAPAILLVPVDQRILAIAFSYGSALLEPGSSDPTFGLRAALNSIKPGKVRSYNKRTFDALFRQTREQAAQVTKLESFGIDAERDLVRKVSGKPENELLGTSMEGGGSLRVAAQVSAEGLVPYLRRLYNQSLLTTYNDEYPWLGRIEEVLDDELRLTLDSYLDDRFRVGADGVWIAVPEIIDSSEEAGFRFIVPTRSREICSELSWPNLCRVCGASITDLGVESLRSQRVELLDGNHHPIKKWTLYECLNAELLVGSEDYVLSSGVWYKVDSDLIGEIDREVNSLEKADLPLPEYDVDDTSEYSYNCRVAQMLPNRFCCLDGKMIKFGGDRNQFELCDLLDSSGALVHVKRYGGSSILSHLFAQGFVSADLLMKRPGFRENADHLVRKMVFTLAEGNDFVSKCAREVVYVIIGGPISAGRHQLPLFARVNLRAAVRGIRAFGWTVRVQFVAETELRQKLRRTKRRATS